MKTTLITLAMLLMLSGCAPKVGSEAWCKAMKEKPNGNWSATEAKDYAKHCVF